MVSFSQLRTMVRIGGVVAVFEASRFCFKGIERKLRKSPRIRTIA